MAIIQSSAQTFTLQSTIRTTYPGGVMCRSSALSQKTITLSVNVPAGSTINSVKFKCSLNRSSPWYGVDIHKINNASAPTTGSFEKVLSNVSSQNVKMEFKSTTDTSVYIPNDTHTQSIQYHTCYIEVDYTPCASTGSLNKNSVPMDGASTIAVTISAFNSNYNHKVKWKTGLAEVAVNLAAGVTADTLTVPLAWNSQHPNATSGGATCTIETYDGATLLGSNTYSFAVTVPPSIVPTASLASEAVNGFNGLYLKGISSARLITTASGAYGSAISQINVSGGGFSGTGSPYTTGILQASGTIIFAVQVVDTRGRAASDTVSVTVTDYNRPIISGVFISRSLSDGTETDEGTYIKAIMSYEVASVTGNAVAAATAKFREAGTPTYSAKVDVPNGGTGVVFGDGAVSIGKTYEVVLEVTDSVGQTSTYYGQVAYLRALYDFRHDKAGIGRVAGPLKTLILPDDWDVIAGALKASDSSTGPKLLTDNGYVTIGPVNVDYCHYMTDRPKHYFNKPVYVSGEIFAGNNYNRKVYHRGNITRGTANPSGGADGDIYIKYS